MNARLTLRRLRAFLRALAAGLFVGVVVELLLAEHTDSPIQLVPFALCGIGLLALGAAWARPNQWTVSALRAAMAVVALGSLVGVAQHWAGNLDVARETLPDASVAGLLVVALTGGAPLLAPGILAVAAALAVAATYSAAARQPAESAHDDDT